MSAATTNDARILAILAQADGAILGWQVDDPVAFVDAHARGVIRFDEDADCYVHPHAVAVKGGGFTLDDDAIADAIDEVAHATHAGVAGGFDESAGA